MALINSEDSLFAGAADYGTFHEPGESTAVPLYSRKDDVPRFRLKEIVECRNCILKELRQDWLGVTAAPALIIDEVLPVIYECLVKVSADITLETLNRHIHNAVISKRLWEHLAVRLAGNLPHLRIQPLTAVTGIDHNQWAVLETVNAEFHRSKQGNNGAMFRFRVRTGQMAGSSFLQFLPLGYLPKYGELLGMGRARWIKHPRMYTGINLLAYLEPADSPSRLFFNKYHASAACKKINKFYARGRTQECIYAYNHTCWNCFRGLAAEHEHRCKYATHQNAWDKRQCPKGHQGWYERHWSPNSVCRRCREYKFGDL